MDQTEFFLEPHRNEIRSGYPRAVHRFHKPQGTTVMNPSGSITRRLVVCACLALAACAQPMRVSTTSRKDPDIAVKLRRVVIVSPPIAKEKPGHAFKSVWIALSEKLKTQGIASTVVEQDPLELVRGRTVREKGRSFNASHFLFLTNVASTMTVRGHTGAGGSSAWDVSVTDVELDKPVWRASVHTLYDHYSVVEQAERISADVVNKLREDGLLQAI